MEHIFDLLKGHKYIVHKKDFRVYWKGSYCLIEIDIFQHTYQFFTKKGLWNHFTNPNFRKGGEQNAKG